MTDRLPVETFNLPINEIRRGYRSAVYFWRAKQTLETVIPDTIATMQVFQKNHAILCGIDEAIAVLRTCTGYYRELPHAEKLFDQYMFNRKADHDELNHQWISEWDDLEVKALNEGDQISPWEPVLQITGRLASFVHLESVYLGLLARRTKVATNVRRVVSAANGKPVLFFADRFDHYACQGGDGFAAHIGGAASVASDAMGNWWGRDGVGTMPHALIAAFNGDIVAACLAFNQRYPDVPLIALVDYNNDCVADSLLAADALGDKLWGVRLDTSENMVDRSIADLWQPNGWDDNTEAFGYTPRFQPGDFKPTGVNPPLVHNVRDALDASGYDHVKIVVSGGFDVDKIGKFESESVPVDSYAVGSSLLRGSNDFTADVVDPSSKQGRWHRDNPRLKVVV